MPDALADWIATYTFPCPRLGTATLPARITPEACQANRADALSGSTCAACDKDGMWQVYQAGDIPTPPRAEKKIKNKKTKETKEVSMPTGYKTCPNCSTEVGSARPMCACGYDFKQQAMPEPSEPEKAADGDEAASQENQPLPAGDSIQEILADPEEDEAWKELDAPVVAENATTEPMKAKSANLTPGSNGKKGKRVIQLNFTPDDPMIRRIDATAERYDVEPSKIVLWMLKGMTFEMVEPEPVEA